jgi:hypothetical protein
MDQKRIEGKYKLSPVDPWPFPIGLAVAGRPWLKYQIVIARSPCGVPSRPQISSPPSMAARDLILRLPSYKVLLLYKSSLWATGRGHEPPRLSLASLHAIAASIIAETT